MKLSKRATGALLLAVGAGVASTQGLAHAAAPKTPAEVAAIENDLGHQEVPYTIPLGAATDPIPLLPDGGEIHGSFPTSPLMPPTETNADPKQPIPDHIVPALNGGKEGPALGATLPLPVADESTDLGTLGLDAPAAPLNLAGPAVGLGRPVTFVEGRSGELTDAALSLDKVDPHLVTGPVQAVPGAKAELGGNPDEISVTDSVQNLTATTTGTVGGILAQAEPVETVGSAMDQTDV
ncbi:hypothetical protein [Kitasatospora terrestris]|uniref:Secreted protein n=1 Tax=Kitasatospora terrestris TaxID=258051 RepID=A0ABP9DNK2_9ACTN